MSDNQPNNYTEVIYRVGTFFLLVGVGLVLIFILSEATQETSFGYFCWGTIFLTVGFMFRAQYKRSYPRSGRFSLIQRLMPKSKDKK